LRATQDSLNRAHSEAEAELAGRQRIWAENDEGERSTADAYFAENMVQLEVTAEKPVPVLSARELVAQQLDSLVNGGRE
jgi:hypothetical protein